MMAKLSFEIFFFNQEVGYIPKPGIYVQAKLLLPEVCAARKENHDARRDAEGQTELHMC